MMWTMCSKHGVEHPASERCPKCEIEENPDISAVIRYAHYGPTIPYDEGLTTYPLTPEFTRTQIRPVESSWTCVYCSCINPQENVHCEHCGAPHTEKPEKLDLEEAQAQARDVERLVNRLQSLSHRLGVENVLTSGDKEDSDKFTVDMEPCERCAGTGKVPWIFGRQRKCPECDGEGKTIFGVEKIGC